MFQLQILSGRAAGTVQTARRLPFGVGRKAGADLRAEEPGVWDEHLRFELLADEGIWVTALAEAPLVINGAPARAARLRNGDLLELGGLKLRFWLAPAPLRSLRMREWFTWGLLAVLTGLQIALLYWLR
ncbi:FHA domain-containing protein [Fontisphaera persica]|uniref:FHA domain-containing protein n=1 Tax=Fontisphaera persica TaxID=2974023 RepID=UPI0024C0291D|nr:FHA domain-containing protein [Fontisphaera persica]WCJ61156.1 FHA domain-containing protein [Fontisphaera persica]